MTSQPQKRLMLRWTAPKNLLAIIVFIIITIVLQYATVTIALPAGTSDPTTITFPMINIPFSVLYHVLPVAVIITLAISFIYLTTQTAMTPAKLQASRKPPSPPAHQKPARLKTLRQFFKNLRRSARRVKQRIIQFPAIAHFQRRIAPAKAIIESAVTVAAIFIIFVVLVAIAAYPTLVPSATLDLYRWNTVFHGFVTATLQASRDIANAIPPIGAAAAAINNALLSAAPAFRSTLEGAASAITAGLVALNPVEKYLAIQNAAAWTTVLVTLLYSWYAKTRRYRR